MCWAHRRGLCVDPRCRAVNPVQATPAGSVLPQMRPKCRYDGKVTDVTARRYCLLRRNWRRDDPSRIRGHYPRVSGTGVLSVGAADSCAPHRTHALLTSCWYQVDAERQHALDVLAPEVGTAGGCRTAMGSVVDGIARRCRRCSRSCDCVLPYGLLPDEKLQSRSGAPSSRVGRGGSTERPRASRGVGCRVCEGEGLTTSN